MADFTQTLGAAIVLGSTLGATVAGFSAYRQKNLVVLLRESNKDYKDRSDQLEAERDELRVKVKTLQDDVAQLKREKTLPLERLTKLVISQHKDMHQSMIHLTKALNTTAMAMKGNNDSPRKSTK